jgi:hypothetical protein
MSKFKLLPAGLIAAAMLTTPVMAREHHLNARHVAADAHASATPAPVTLTGISATRLPAWAHLPHSPGITTPLANPRRVIDPSASR